MFKFSRDGCIIFIDGIRDVFKCFMFCDGVIIMENNIFMIHYNNRDNYFFKWGEFGGGSI